MVGYLIDCELLDQTSYTTIQYSDPDFPTGRDIGLRYVHFLAFLYYFFRCVYAEISVFLLPVQNLILASFSAMDRSSFASFINISVD